MAEEKVEKAFMQLKACFFKQLCNVFGLKPEKLTAVLLQGGTLGSCVQRVWSQSDTMTGEGWGACLKARQNWDVDTGKRVGENGSTSALMRAGGMSVSCWDRVKDNDD